MKDTVSQVIHQLEEHFPVVCIKSGQHSVLIDYTEMVFKPGLVSEVMMPDKNDDSDESSQEGSNTMQSNKEGVMFYRQRRPVPLHKRFPPKCLILLNSTVLLHMYEEELVLQARVGYA